MTVGCKGGGVIEAPAARGIGPVHVVAPGMESGARAGRHLGGAVVDFDADTVPERTGAAQLADRPESESV